MIPREFAVTYVTVHCDRGYGVRTQISKRASRGGNAGVKDGGDVELALHGTLLLLGNFSKPSRVSILRMMPSVAPPRNRTNSPRYIFTSRPTQYGSRRTRLSVLPAVLRGKSSTITTAWTR